MLRRALELTAASLRKPATPPRHDTPPESRAQETLATYRTPDDLSRTATQLGNVLLIGSCLVEVFGRFAPKPVQVDHLFFNNYAPLPPTPPRPIANYDFQIIQLPLRSLLEDGHYFRLSPTDVKAHEELFEFATARIAQMLEQAMKWNVANGLLTFVMNFLPPQQNPLGKLMPRHDLRNFVYFVERLNEVLSGHLRNYANAYLLDIDQISANLGRRYFQDDLIYAINHGSSMSNWDFHRDQRRLVPPLQGIEQLYDGKPVLGMTAIWSEALSLYRAVRQIDAVKLVIVDLDDTLWRGLLVEEGGFTSDTTEGWPLGLAEALLFLKKRGLLLAIASRNDRTKIEALWDQVWRRRITLDDFVARKIDWRPKVESIAEILKETNVLARNVVFIDDNPAERAQVEAAFPGIRVLGADLYSLRRILLWSSETQVVGITDEAARRTDLVRSRVERESLRQQLPRSEFLALLQLKSDLLEIRSIKDSRFARALELLNRTNQFNTTGRRWTMQDCVAHFAGGGLLYALEVQDRFTDYGLVSVVVVADDTIEQFVMSCRVAGIDLECRIIADVCQQIERAGFFRVRARFAETDANLPCRDLFRSCGFDFSDGVWHRPLAMAPLPS